jgi:hypothetical protein
VGAFIIEGFAIDQPSSTRFLAEKLFSHPVTLRFSVPATVPVRVSSPSGGFTFGFYDTTVMTAAETSARFSAIADVIARKEVYVVEFTNVDKIAFTIEEVGSFADDYNLILLKSDGPADDALETQCFTLRILKSHWSPEKERELHEGLRELFDLVFVAFCKNCGLLYSPGDTEQCVTYKHKGRQLRFESGQLEEVEMDEDDQPIVIVKWSCCGEVPVDEPGCEPVPRGPHVLNEAKTDYCKFAIAASIVYPK